MQNNESEKKRLLACKSPSADKPFDDVLTNTICLVTAVENVIPFIIPKM